MHRHDENRVDLEGAVTRAAHRGAAPQAPPRSGPAGADRDAAALYLREIAAGLSNGGMVLVRNIGTDEMVADREAVDRLMEIAELVDGKTLEQAAMELEK